MLELVLASIAAAAVLVLLLPNRWSPVLALFGLGAGATFALLDVRDLAHGVVTTGFNGMLRLDGPASVVLLLVLGLGFLAALVSSQTEEWPRRFYALLLAFTGTMALAATADNLGLLWASIEATTLSSALLVGHHRTRQATEAAWKYLILSSTGILFAFVATLVLLLASRDAGGATLSWSQLMTEAHTFDPGLVRLALVLAIVGYGTKAGLVPYHFWLPDAHSEAPSPVSGLLSGVLLSCALLALDRFIRLARAADEPMTGLLFTFGVLSVVVGGALILAARTFKRMLAYSSVENMGLVAFALGVGTPLALAGAYLHVLAHGVAKSLAFFAAGRVHHHVGSVNIADARHLLLRSPAAGRGLLVGIIALAGLPPLAPFAGKVAILAAALPVAPAGFTIPLLIGLALAFVGFLRHVAAMMSNDPAPGSPSSPPAREPWTVVVAMGLLVAANVVLCLLGAALLEPLLSAAGSTTGGTP